MTCVTESLENPWALDILSKIRSRPVCSELTVAIKSSKKKKSHSAIFPCKWWNSSSAAPWFSLSLLRLCSGPWGWNRWVDKIRDICDTGTMNNTSALPGAFLNNVFYMVMLVGKCQSELSSSVSRKPLCALRVEPAEAQQLSRPANTLIWREDRHPALLKAFPPEPGEGRRGHPGWSRLGEKPVLVWCTFTACCVSIWGEIHSHALCSS